MIKGNFTILFASDVHCSLLYPGSKFWNTCLKSVFIKNHFLFRSIFPPSFLNLPAKILRNSGAEYRFFIIWFSRGLIISFAPYYLLHNLSPCGSLKGLFLSSSFDKSMPVTTAFDLTQRNDLIFVLQCQEGSYKDWPSFRGKKTTSGLSHTWKVFSKAWKPLILSLYTYFVSESDTSASCSLLGVAVSVSCTHFCVLLFSVALCFYKCNSGPEKHFISHLILYRNSQ